MNPIRVLKFGSSVLRSPADLHIAVHETYRRWREGNQILAIVSAFEGVTDRLLAEATNLIGTDCPEATASYVAAGEQRTAALLLGSLQRFGIPSRTVEPWEIHLIAKGTPLASLPAQVSVPALHQLWNTWPILILPGFHAVDEAGRTVLFGRGGSDLSAIFLAAELSAECQLYKDVPGVFDVDPVQSIEANRYELLSWTTAARIAGRLIQPQALQYAQSRQLKFDVQRPNESLKTQVGSFCDHRAGSAGLSEPLRVALVGYGTVGRGVRALLERQPDCFAVRYVVVRDVNRHSGIANLTADLSVIGGKEVDVVVICTSHGPDATAMIQSALWAGKLVVTANKAAIAELGSALSPHIREPHRQLWYSAAVGGALPVLETLANLQSPIKEVRGILNGTCGVVLDEWAAGRSFDRAIATAQSAGFAEADPSRDISGRDSADKLMLIAHAAFGHWLRPEETSTTGIRSIQGNPTGYKLIARVREEHGNISSSVKPERHAPDSFLGEARGAENRVEIELTNGEILRLRGQGAGCWPTAVSVVADLHEIARRRARSCSAECDGILCIQPANHIAGKSFAPSC